MNVEKYDWGTEAPRKALLSHQSFAVLGVHRLGPQPTTSRDGKRDVWSISAYIYSQCRSAMVRFYHTPRSELD